jgi:phosphatidylglycerophosphatase A
MPGTAAPHKPNRVGQVPFPARFIATGLFSGYSPVAPGTAGSLVGLAFYLIPGFDSPGVLASASVVIFFTGVLAAAQMERALGDDPPVVVIDEVVGMWISLLFLPKTVPLACLAFLFFRGFDIVKPPPARWLEQYGNGWGIMLDDVAAAVYANAAVRLMMLLLPVIR